MTRHRRRDPAQRILDAGAAVEPFEIIGERADRGFALGGLEQCRNRGQPKAVSSELLDLDPEPLERGRVGGQRLALRRRQLDHDRREQPLALESPGRQPFHHLLEQHALVRDVLIDDRHPLVVDGDDERIAELPERSHRADVDPASPPERWQSLSAPDAGSAGSAHGSPDGVVLGRPPAPDGRTRQDAGDAHRTRLLRNPASDGVKSNSGARPWPERVDERAPQDLVHEPLLEKSHLGLRRMDVHVHAIGRNLDEEMHLGTPLLDRRDAVGLLMACAIVRSRTIRRFTKTCCGPRAGPCSPSAATNP